MDALFPKIKNFPQEFDTIKDQIIYYEQKLQEIVLKDNVL